MAGILAQQPRGSILGAPWEGGSILGGRPSFATMYPPHLVNATNPLPSYRPSEEEMVRAAIPDLAPTQFVKAMVGGLSDRAAQFHQAMPWGGNDPTAIGIDPQQGMIDPSVMVPWAVDAAGAVTTGALAAPPVAGAAGMGIRAYHGSPHDFDRFSMDKIGTGEGAQAYGHGLYFAENEGVARQYRKDLTAMRVGKAQRALDAAGGDVDAAIAATQDKIKNLKGLPNAGNDPERQARFIQYNEETLAELNAVKRGDGMSRGSMYEVDIDASPDEFLDWDKPLSEQPAKVREAVKASYGDIRPVRLKDGSYSVTRVRSDGSGDTIWDVKAATADEALAQFDDWLAAASGRDVYQQVARGLDVTPGSEQGAATGNFRAAGIKGIRYRDAGSRTPLDGDALTGTLADLDRQIANAEREIAAMPENMARDYEQHIARLRKERAAVQKKLEPTSNYVVFDDNIIDILKKYGIAGLTAGGAGAALLGGAPDASATPASYTTGGRF